MRKALKYLLGVLVILIGFGGMLGYDMYYKPYVLAKPVLKVKTATGQYLPKNHQIQEKDIYSDSVQTKDIPEDAITDINEVIDRIANVNLPNGTILTQALVDVNDLEPAENEGIYPIPKEDIYAINGSLRSRDKVDIYIVSEIEKYEQTGEPIPSISEAAFKGVTVTYVRTEENNDVFDTESGNNNKRLTSTGKVSSPEIKLSTEDGEELKGYLEQGNKLWIVRVE
ncbi:SAF domain-containing protein [Paenibacillus tepidiphilus]|uniref:SAF domain-containing protein n=1 Tax=Paenibacillus tepidiphilus TaxID=2608683 RepID=UPI00123C19DC|nr:SAF domain-containing protein [Paenibacillus tepidiphilus]